LTIHRLFGNYSSRQSTPGHGQPPSQVERGSEGAEPRGDLSGCATRGGTRGEEQRPSPSKAHSPTRAHPDLPHPPRGRRRSCWDREPILHAVSSVREGKAPQPASLAAPRVASRRPRLDILYALPPRRWKRLRPGHTWGSRSGTGSGLIRALRASDRAAPAACPRGRRAPGERWTGGGASGGARHRQGELEGLFSPGTGLARGLSRMAGRREPGTTGASKPSIVPIASSRKTAPAQNAHLDLLGDLVDL
jgi:hypothetical protein